MKHIAALLLIPVFLILQFSCTNLSPENEAGHITLSIHTPPLLKASPQSATLAQINCKLIREGTTLRTKTFLAQNGRFNILMDNIEPHDNYALLVWGNSNEKETIARSYRAGIQVLAGMETQIIMQWAAFKITQTAPLDSTTINNRQPNLCWRSLGETSCFEVEIDTSITFKSKALIFGNTSDTTFTPSLPSSDATYFWRVRGVDAHGFTGNWTLSRRLLLDLTGPEPPMIMLPKNHSTVKSTWLRFQWLSSEDATSYEIVVDNDKNLNSPVIHKKNLTAQWFLPRYSDIYLENGKYYWRVRCFDWYGNAGPWSELYDFVRQGVE